MKICILTPRFPFPEHAGDVLRINNIAQYLKQRGNTILLLSFIENNNFSQWWGNYQLIYDKIFLVKRNKVFSYFCSFFALLFRKPMQLGFYFSFRLFFWFLKIKKIYHPDIIIAHLIRMVPYLLLSNTTRNVIVEMTDVLSKTYDCTESNGRMHFKNLLYFLEKKPVRKYEKKIVNIFPKIVLVSNEDKKLLPENNVVCYRNGIDIHPRAVDIDFSKIIFIGNMRTMQNKDAVFYFVKDIYPLIKKHNKNMKFYIIGAEPSSSVLGLTKSDNSIVVTGYVDNIIKIIENAVLSVAPVRIAAGVQNKVLFSLAVAIPVVLTSLIAGAIPELEDGANCFIRDNAKSFADICIRLTQNKSLNNYIGYQGQKMVKKNYIWEKCLENYEVI
jgi:glycosyltransferase involved in cell wall biosynthesis